MDDRICKEEIQKKKDEPVDFLVVILQIQRIEENKRLKFNIHREEVEQKGLERWHFRLNKFANEFKL